MSNTTATAVKVPNVATIRKALTAAGVDHKGATPRDLKVAWLALNHPTATPAPAKATPAPAKPAKAADKPAPAKVPAPRPAPANCGCGCGQPTVTAKATFVSGHDARLAGVLGRALSANPKDKDALTRTLALSPKLQAKVVKVKETADRKVAEKAARAKAAAAAKAAYAAAMAS